MFDEEYCASEDSVTMNCDPCQFEGIQQDARAFCQECKEFLCQQCRQSHRKFQAFRQHHILHGDSMPRTRQEIKPKLTLKLCDDHQMNEVQFYCSTHKSVICSLCKMVKHSTCCCKMIDEICEKDDETRFYNVVKEIEAIKNEFDQLKTDHTEMIDSISATSRLQRALLHSVRKEMNEYFDHVENEITGNECQDKSNITELRENVAIYTDAINNLASLQEHVGHVAKSNDKVAIFAAKSKLEKILCEYTVVKTTIILNPKTEKSRRVSQELLTVRQMWDNIKKNVNTRSWGEENEEVEDKDVERRFTGANEQKNAEINTNQIDDMQHESCRDNSNDASRNAEVDKTDVNVQDKNVEPKQQGCISVKSNYPKESTTRMKPEAKKQDTSISFDNLKVKNIFYKPIISEMSDSICDITGSLFLPNGSLILCDHANSNVILLDKNFLLLHKLHFTGNLWDAALVNASLIVVSLRYQKLLKYIRIESGQLHESIGINLKRVPWGVAVYKDKILVAFHDNPGNGVIEVRNKQGKILRNIAADTSGKELLDSPYYITVNQKNGDIFVTDGRKNSVTCLSFEGKLLYKMESKEFSWPRKVILDDQGNCLLCASQSNRMLMIKNKFHSPLKSKEETGDFRVWLRKCNRPQTVSIRQEDQAIIVGIHKANTMIVII